MTDEFDMDAEFARLRAEMGAPPADDPGWNYLGEEMLIDALERAVASNDPDLRRRDPSVVFWSQPAKPGWGWDDNE
jgi:hypothetical protein